jgi:hypothetical protein
MQDSYEEFIIKRSDSSYYSCKQMCAVGFAHHEQQQCIQTENPTIAKTTEETAVSPKHLTQPIGSTGFLALILKDDRHWKCVQNTVRQDTGTSSNGNYWITG